MKNVKVLATIGLIFAVGCSKENASSTTNKITQSTKAAVNRVAGAFDADAPFDNKPVDRKAWEKERFDARWRQLQSFRDQQATQAAAQQQAAATTAAPPAAPPANFRFVAGVKETFKGVGADAINNAPVSVPVTGDVKGPSVLRAQVYLDRIHFSVGAIDGRWGRNSAITTWWYQRTRGMQPTGDLDQATFGALASEAQYAPVVRSYTLTAADMKGPFVQIPEDVYEKQKLDCLCYESLKEKISERFHVDQDFLDVLNPDMKWSDLKEGSAVVVPNVREPLAADQPDIAKVVISIAGNSYNAFDASGRIVFHAPTTLGSTFDPSPQETLKLIKVVPDPHFHYDPTLYAEVDDSEPDANLAPGPNSPVGIVWMALSKPHYGMHGTPDPESIGYASSHGCVRLTNWDAGEVEHRITKGVEISFVDTRSEGMPEVAKKK